MYAAQTPSKRTLSITSSDGGSRGGMNPIYQRGNEQSTPLFPQAAMMMRSPQQQPAVGAPGGGMAGMQMPTAFGGYPSSVYSPQMTNDLVNQQTALAQNRAALPALLGQMSRPGMSMQSPAIFAQALGPLLQAKANDIAPRQQFEDWMTNSQFGIANQLLAHQDRMQMAGLGEKYRGLQQGQQTQDFNFLVRLLGGLLG